MTTTRPDSANSRSGNMTSTTTTTDATPPTVVSVPELLQVKISILKVPIRQLIVIFYTRLC